ncbi:MAG: aminopeptidase P family N-terminal domain-containing protein [Candidatus Freyarchaeota archaeon]
MFNLEKARELMETRNLDGIIVSSPENFYYVSGYISPHSAKIGVTTAILPRSQDQDPAVVVMDWEAEKTREYTWIKDIRTFETWIHFEKEDESLSRSESKPEQFDPVQLISNISFTHLQACPPRF